ncbi:sigma-70 family RNA polymerase sigma factor [Pelomicrobium methylotrophicum]|uniref:RNA polymerase sigma factor n=1 Tax=Pelomicrobium methylotrophicum TaxID=2602750 RepID=A0A5C7EKF1_9PROT|nr:sigma-70 family RNA polymerase sigma factor [Pelomicrobium methylotrophicum]TXF11961.1 sigma-70 family RNA polymerase sigma factor [Pelomicrobium methylotrophicum]
MVFGFRRRAFETLVRAHAPDLYRFAYWLCRDRFLAEDLVQETFARAWKAWDSLRREASGKAWLFSILYREHARLYERKRLETEALDPEEVLAGVEQDMEAGISLRAALERLPGGYREPLLLQVLGGFSCAEIGRMLRLSEANVMQRVSRARKALRGLLEEEATRWKERR